MATAIWRGDAQVVPQVTTIDFDVKPGTGETVTVTCNGKDLVFTVTASETTIALVSTAVAALIGTYDNDVVEFAEMSAALGNTDQVVITGPTTGKPFIVTAATSDGLVTVTVSTTTTAISPNHANAAENWSTGSVPGTGDTVIFENSSVDCLYGLDAITGDTLAALRIKSSYTGRIGLPVYSDLGYREYRDLQLQLGATLCVIGEGTGTGSGRINLDLEAVQTEVIVYSTGDADDTDIGAVTLAGSHASNVVRVYRGSVGLATLLETDTMTAPTLELSYVDNPDTDSVCIVGRGTTLSTVKVYGGEHQINADFATMEQEGGITRLYSPVSPATKLEVFGGICYYESDGTLTQGYVSQTGVIEFGPGDARTVTNMTMYSGGTVRDRFGTVTWSNAIVLVGCGLDDVTLDLQTGVSILPS